MASVPNEPRPVLGRLDKAGRLISADPELEALQREAGGDIGKALALPQVAAVAELARRLGTSVARPALAASLEHDIDLWVRATPEGDEIALSLEGWTERAPAGPRLASLLGGGGESEAAQARREWAADEELRLIMMSGDLAEYLGDRPRRSRRPAADAGVPAGRGRGGGNAADQRARLAPRLHRPARAQPRRRFARDRAQRRGRDRRRRRLRRLPRDRGDAGRGDRSGRPGTNLGLRQCARRSAALAARPDHRKRRADRRTRRRPAAQRLCELRQRHRDRGAAFAVGHPLDERRAGAGPPDHRPRRARGRSGGDARIPRPRIAA